MKQLKKWLIMAMVLLCSVAEASAEITVIGLTGTVSENEAGTSQYEYISEILSCETSFRTIVLTFLSSSSIADPEKTIFPWVSLAEFCLYDGEGNEVALTAENFSTNAQEPTEGPIENICDGDRTTFFHSMWTVDAGEHHKLMITLPEELEMKELRFKYITRWTNQGYPLKIGIATGTDDVISLRGNCGENATYTLYSDGQLDISGSGVIYDDYFGRYQDVITNVAIQEGVTSIGDHAFRNCSNLTSITIPEGVTEIGAGTFSFCSSLASITLPEGVTDIRAGTFYGCSSLASITIPESVTRIGEPAITIEGVIDIGAFSGCSSLASITIPEGVTEIGAGTFSGCSSLTSITIPEGVASIGCQAFRDCSSLTSITIPEGVTSIEDYAFFDCSSLTSITIPESIEEIGYDAFYGTAWLNNKPDGVLYIGKILYRYVGTMPKNTHVKVENGTESISRGAFIGCTNLASITLPESVTSVGDHAFEGCSNLERVEANCSHVGDWFHSVPVREVVLGDNVQTVASTGWSTLEYVEMNCTDIEDWFSHNATIKEVVLGDNVVGIKANAFEGFATITIGCGVSTIGTDAFRNCITLSSITCHAATPPSHSGRTSPFRGIDTAIPVYVPAASVSSYQSARHWNGFTNFIALETNINNKGFIDQSSDTTAIYDLRGYRVENCTRGEVYIKNGRKFVAK